MSKVKVDKISTLDGQHEVDVAELLNAVNYSRTIVQVPGNSPTSVMSQAGATASFVSRSYNLSSSYPVATTNIGFSVVQSDGSDSTLPLYGTAVTFGGVASSSSGNWLTQLISTANPNGPLMHRTTINGDPWGPMHDIYSSSNATLDASGFLRLRSNTKNAVTTDSIFYDASGVVTSTSGAISNSVSLFLSKANKNEMRASIDLEPGQWVDLRPYITAPFYWDDADNVDNRFSYPRARLLPYGNVQLDGVVMTNQTDSAPNVGTFMILPEIFRPGKYVGLSSQVTYFSPLMFTTCTMAIRSKTDPLSGEFFAIPQINNPAVTTVTKGQISLNVIYPL